jgi:hypothetical protein
VVRLIEMVMAGPPIGHDIPLVDDRHQKRKDQLPI